MNALRNEPLAPYTSLKVGGNAETLIVPESYDEVVAAAQSYEHAFILGYGANVLISDKGLPGVTILMRSNAIEVDGSTVIAEAGVWWDDVVKAAIDHGLWGLELTSEIPSSVGAAIYGNIAAYGQQVSDTLAWVEAYDRRRKEVVRLQKDAISFSYRASSFQNSSQYVIVKAAFNLSPLPLHVLKYDSAIAIAEELGHDPTVLSQCREIIIETRRRAGSIYHPDEPSDIRTAGSFFKNPLVTEDQAKHLASFDETGKTLERIQNQSKIHGGNAQRASAAHVLLAAGFHRGQRWNSVELHPSHILKLATLPGATSQEVYNVAHEIKITVKSKLGIDLETEVKFLGVFD